MPARRPRSSECTAVQKKRALAQQPNSVCVCPRFLFLFVRRRTKPARHVCMYVFRSNIAIKQTFVVCSMTHCYTHLLPFLSLCCGMAPVRVLRVWGVESCAHAWVRCRCSEQTDRCVKAACAGSKQDIFFDDDQKIYSPGKQNLCRKSPRGGDRSLCPISSALVLFTAVSFLPRSGSQSVVSFARLHLYP